MEIRVKGQEREEVDIVIFGNIDRNGFEDEYWNKIQPKLFFKMNKISNISSDLRKYFTLELELPNSSKDLGEKFGKKWLLKINKVGKTNIDEENKIFNLSYADFEIFLNNNSIMLIKRLKNGINNVIKNGVNPQISTKNRNTLIFGEETFQDYVKDTENVIPFIKNVILETKNKITDKITNSQKDRVKKEYDDLLSKPKIKEKDLQDFIINNKSILLSEGVYVGAEEKFSNIFGDRTKNSFFDILIITKYGVAKIIELKKHDEYILKYDKSHNKFIPTPATSAAISQLNNYLRIISRNENGEAEDIGIKKGYEPFSEGMLIIGMSNNLYDPKQSSLKGVIKSEADEMARAELLSLSFNQKNLNIITYDDFVNLATNKTDEND